MDFSVLKGICHIVNSGNFSLEDKVTGVNRLNQSGEMFELYVQNALSGCLLTKDDGERTRQFLHAFSYKGNNTHPPDLMLRDGAAFEVKKTETKTPNEIALNSSSPKDYLHRTESRINEGCRNAEAWTKKDFVYVLGHCTKGIVRDIYFCYGDCLAANQESYLKVHDSVVKCFDGSGLTFGKTKELGRLNGVDILRRTSLRIRGMWIIQSPQRAFPSLKKPSDKATFCLRALVLTSTYDSMREYCMTDLNEAMKKGLQVIQTQIYSPNNAAKMLDATYIFYEVAGK